MNDDFVVMHPDPLERVRIALDDLRAGRMVILVDDEDRENEGDLVFAAEKVTPEAINFMAKHARGLICLTLTGAQVDRLGLPMMSAHNQSPYHTAFTVSIEAREGVSTGISAADRARTVATAVRPDVTRVDVVTPGHVFPLRAREGGVLERVGQTEGSVDLARLAGLLPAGVICEIMNDDGTMARLPELLAFGREHRIHLCAVADLIKHRMQTERIVEVQSEGALDVPGSGRWHARLYRGVAPRGLHLALWKGEPGPEPTLVRVQAAPPAWSFLSPAASDWSRPAQEAAERIAADGRGVLVFMHVGGLADDVVVRAFERDVGKREAPAAQASADALRDLGAGCQILSDLGLRRLRLLSSSTRPLVGVEAYGLEIVERVPLPA
jgi:3,4-dihydroxy 2-butanone 4-phosphate synthase/GTP cyclohydrolase II